MQRQWKPYLGITDICATIYLSVAEPLTFPPGVDYGDMSPVTTMARTFATLEALTGQAYLTILGARLAGMHLVVQGKAADSNNSEELSDYDCYGHQF